MIVVKPGTRAALVMFGWFAFARLTMLGLSGAQHTAPHPCCFVRTGYQGACVVQPGKGETCKSILHYLNSPRTTGKTYCGGTILRGGWSLVDCETPSEHGR